MKMRSMLLRNLFKNMNKQKFNIGDRVQTNLKYVNGFGENHGAPSGLNLLKNLEVTDVVFVECEHASNRHAENYLYTLKSKTKEYHINQCFLETNELREKQIRK